MNKKEKLIHLHHCRGAGWKTIQAIMSKDPSLSSLFTTNYVEWAKMLPIPSNKLNLFLKDLHSLHSIEKLKKYEDSQIHCLTIFDDEYPFLLKQIFDPPWVLYFKGDKKLLTRKNTLGVVGTRKPTSYGLEALKTILLPLVKKKFVIISGMAAGIDAESHKIALREGGDTIGVLGGGLKQIYPKSNFTLAEEIMNKGLLISETPPEVKAEPWMFPLRNRIISGLSQGVFVVEAKERSGSLITAQAALEHGREVFALPGNVTSPESLGTNQLIYDGAKLVFSSRQIEEEF
ncbi:DNA-processing protein DprA [Peribacillus castrilensis]|uniref:DNA protecting protein DprA n=1 Tax=Peribacillus simplex TaxID=1478 RepID=A0AAN2PFX1_9BACI|nr:MULTISPECIES: DNA-processing protein DprA [Bacillaceae]MCP1093035.1 DNA-processing protein DprA [Bacillaceae bacterium OS4b]MCF7621742.1 DNA-processing protein DprA [Peribacillus frigoritolerans]MCP1152400.1 DNA-processing protein DprA [Peribacillus frigoritolerans]MCT1387327.1 DNA-processing protein DprA [Peribacillus frigoritolerans]MEA3572831.1 DNA-processing protein DprA [Peribacillus frigoritolerans]